MSLSESLKEIQEELVKKDAVRREIQTAMRKTTKLSKQAIFLVHKDQLEKAENVLKEAEKILAQLSDLSESYPDLSHMGNVDAAFEEYTEAHVLLSLVKNGRFVSFKDINVPRVSYVLGLADVIGELRRRALDSLRKSGHEAAEKCLELMETIYGELMNLDEVHFLISGLRRKCDIARRVIEATRGDVTIDARRRLLEDSIDDLKKILEAERTE
ncbi:MAG: hypothetical protein NWF14_02370 [Candidatus Bathyarchaeota archaeon]|nr:hypothetical protein [Candidatus Bathyarchaeota archaeon]